ncbi:MAG: molybdopterin-dependent oxidoreductase, partial [Chromatiales bacterium]|nr:molybdopterin-dependent oxidoreductase [Chromatiales bacterium]
VIDEHGADQVGVLASPNATVEEHYLLQKLARGLGINSVDHRLREGDFRDQSVAPAYSSLGRPIAELEHAGAVLVVGCNARKELPLLNHRLRKAAIAGGAVRCLNAVNYSTNFNARPGRVVSPALWLTELHGVAKALAEATGADAGAWAAADVDDWHRAAADELLSGENSVVILGALSAAHPDASSLRACAARIAEMAGASAGMLGTGANQAGAALAGMLPHRGPGAVPSNTPGSNAREMLARPRKAYILLGVEPELDCLEGQGALDAISGAQCVVSLCGYDTESARQYADALLPIAQFAETDGSLVNASGQWQSYNAAVSPPGEARPAWKVLRVLGNVFELDGFEYMRSEVVRDEVRGQCEGVAMAGLTVADAIQAGATSDALWRCGDVPIYATDALVRRAPALQRTLDGMAPIVARLNPADAERLGLTDGQGVRVQQNGASIELPLTFDADVASGCVQIPSGVAASAALGGAIAPVSVEAAG